MAAQPLVRIGAPDTAARLASAGSPDGADDSVLAERIRSGDNRAFEVVVVAYLPCLVAFAARFLRSTDAATDVVQDVFAELWTRRGRFVDRLIAEDAPTGQ